MCRNICCLYLVVVKGERRKGESGPCYRLRVDLIRSPWGFPRINGKMTTEERRIPLAQISSSHRLLRYLCGGSLGLGFVLRVTIIGTTGLAVRTDFRERLLYTEHFQTVEFYHC